MLNFLTPILFCVLLFTVISVPADNQSYIHEHWITNYNFQNEIVNFARQSYREAYPDFFTEQQLAEIFTPEYFESRHNQTFVILIDNGSVIGYAKLIFQQKSQAKLDKLYVSSDYQSKGLGKSLLYRCFDEAKNQGNTHINLEVWIKNPRAIKFYSQHGFKLTNELKRYYNNGIPTDEYDQIMTANLNHIVRAENIIEFNPCDIGSLELCILII